MKTSQASDLQLKNTLLVAKLREFQAFNSENVENAKREILQLQRQLK